MVAFLFTWGVMCFSPIGFLVSARIKMIIPSAIAVLLLSAIGWWIGGGLVPAEIWPGWLGFLAMIWPGTYYFRSFINLIITGSVEPNLLFVDLSVTGLYGLIIFSIAVKIFMREARS